MIKDSPDDYLSYSRVATAFEWITMGMESPPKKWGFVNLSFEMKSYYFCGEETKSMVMTLVYGLEPLVVRTTFTSVEGVKHSHSPEVGLY